MAQRKTTRPRPHRRGARARLMQPGKPRLARIAAGALLLLLALAWFDGGEEPLHPIRVDIPAAPISLAQNSPAREQ